MVKEYEEQINALNLLLDTMPKNNVKNKAAYSLKLDESINEYEKIKQYLLSEMKNRYIVLSSKKHSVSLEEDEKELEGLLDSLLVVMPINTPFEKSGLDKIIYNLRHYYDDTLINITNNIKAAIKVFNQANIYLNINDFDYTPYCREFMLCFFDNIESEDFDSKMKIAFENVYWKCPEVIKHIELNIMSLYVKYKRKLNKLYNKKINELLKKLDCASSFELVDAISEKIGEIQIKEKEETDNLIDSFINNVRKTSEFKDKNIIDCYKLFINKDLSIEEFKSFNNDLEKLRNSILENQNYLKYQYIVASVKKIVSEKDQYKNIYKTTYKAIIKNEKILNKINKLVNKSIKKDGSLIIKASPQMNDTINELSNYYKELSYHRLYEWLIENINDNSSVYDCLRFTYSCFSFLEKSMKNNEDFESLDINKINDEHDELAKFLLNPYNNVLKNVYIKQEIDIPLVISDHYKILNIDINKSDIKEDSEKFIKALDNILVYEKILNSNISFNEIDFLNYYEKNIKDKEDGEVKIIA